METTRQDPGLGSGQREQPEMFWTTDPMHFPDPQPALDAALNHIFHEVGFNTAAEEYDIPVRFNVRHVHGYAYMAVAPLPLTHEELEALGKRSEQKIGAAMGRQWQDWQERYLPEIKRQIAETADLDYERASNEELARDIETAIARVAEQWKIHFRIALPMLMSMSLFEEFYRDVFAESDPLEAYKLLQGLDNLTVQGGRELWKLSRQARQSPDVLAILRERDASEVVAALGTSAPGKAFLASLEDWLRRNGYRGNSLGVSDSVWVEDPSQVIRMLQDYVARTDYDPDAEQTQLAAERERAVAEARERLKDYPEQVVGQFEFLLKAAQEAVVLSEDHAFWIDFRALYELRRLAVAVGARLAAMGVIARPEDVFQLEPAEMAGALTAPSGRDYRSLVAERDADLEAGRRNPPPPVIGNPPAGAPPDNPIARTIGRFFGGPAAPSDEPGRLNGTAGSAGRVTGRVKVLHSLDEAHKLQPGDVLVVQTTTPPWTPLFNTAAAVVTDTGGVLSHCAVVAREYGIPAVVGTRVATQLLKDGDLVEVDGRAGLVRIVGG